MERIRIDIAVVVMWCAHDAGSGQAADSVIRRSRVCAGSFGISRGPVRRFRHPPEILVHELFHLGRIEIAHDTAVAFSGT